MANEMIHVRLPPDELSELRAAASANTRTLQDEVRHRLRLNPHRSDGDTAHHWIMRDNWAGDRTSRARALGELLAMVAERAERHVKPEQDLAAYLGTVRDAMARMLDGLGAGTGKEAGGIPLSLGITWDLISELTQPEPRPDDDPALTRIREALAPHTPEASEPKVKPRRKEK